MRNAWRFLVVATLVGPLACSSSTADEGGGSSSSSGQGGSAQGGAGGALVGGGSSSSSSSSGLGGGFNVGGFAPIAVMDLPGLESITFHERTGGTEPTPYTFTVDGPELTIQLADPMSPSSHDIPGATSEYYDVYYSDETGGFQLDGSYLTISGVFLSALPDGGGLNLAEIGLNFVDQTTEYGNYLASYVVLGDNGNVDTVERCIDDDLQTHTTMGNTVGASERLRLTLGFESTSGPPPR